MPTASVTLHVTKFVAGGDCTISRPEITGSGGNRVFFKYPAVLDDNSIVAKGKGNSPLSIAFTVPGFTPGNVSFRELDQNGDGSKDFPKQTIVGSTVTIDDVFASAGLGATMPKWEYSIPITPISGPRGAAGTIDPEIDNELDVSP